VGEWLEQQDDPHVWRRDMSIVDVRAPDAYRQNHIPYAVNIPADVLRANLRDPAKLAELLGPSGVDAAHEAVIVSNGGLNPDAALAFLALERVGQKKVSVLMESMDDWGLAGFVLTKDPTIVGMPKSPQDNAVMPASYAPRVKTGTLADPSRGVAGPYPRVFLASGKNAPQKVPADAKVVHVPYSDLLDASGKPKPAAEIWKVLVKAGVPRYAEIVCVSDDAGEAAVNYFLLKMMGFPDVKVAA
jgi:3-mercaptopyruvate sulfurtransferase SseA